jgi:hypothetical protein
MLKLRSQLTRENLLRTLGYKGLFGGHSSLIPNLGPGLATTETNTGKKKILENCPAVSQRGTDDRRRASVVRLGVDSSYTAKDFDKAARRFPLSPPVRGKQQADLHTRKPRINRSNDDTAVELGPIPTPTCISEVLQTSINYFTVVESLESFTWNHSY